MSVNRVAAIPLQLGVLSAALVVLPYKLFELDRYFVPKELVLHAVALVLLVVLLSRGRTTKVDAADALLAAFLAWSLLSSLFATNHWLAQRALGLSFSSAVVFWGARWLGENGSARRVVAAGAVAGVLSAVTVLAQAYGFESAYFSFNRAPGGTFGNRNFAAHFGAIALPALIYSSVTAHKSVVAFAGSLGMAAVSAALVLSRSRAAWLAVTASLAIAAAFLLLSRSHWRGGKIGPRLAQLALAALLAAVVAIVLPNDLNWRSDSPYLDSARGMVDYRTGSGRGRVAQYRNSAELATNNPIFGVGPGNWPVHYPASRRAATAL